MSRSNQRVVDVLAQWSSQRKKFMKLPNNDEHNNCWFMNGVMKEFEKMGWKVEQIMESDGLHICLTKPGDWKPSLEFFDL